MPRLVCLATALTLAAGAALAEPVSVSAILEPKEQIRWEFADGAPHFILAVRREGKATGEGPFAGAQVTEFGWHDIRPGQDGDPRGYLTLIADNGDTAVLRWEVKAVFMAGDERPALFDNGYWELVRGTGQFANQRGVGSLVIKPAGGPKREFILEGEVGDAP